MEEDLSWILYDGSPFLPPVTFQNVDNVTNMINDTLIPPGLAVAIETILIGTSTHEQQEKSLEELAFLYFVDSLSLSHYLFGFTTPPILMRGAYLSNKLSLKNIIKIICEKTKDEYLLQVNEYKAWHLIRAIELYQTREDRHPKVAGIAIYNHCQKNPMVQDFYYLLGLEASQMVYEKLFTMFDL